MFLNSFFVSPVKKVKMSLGAFWQNTVAVLTATCLSYGSLCDFLTFFPEHT